jgi:hypothetical protein
MGIDIHGKPVPLKWSIPNQHETASVRVIDGAPYRFNWTTGWWHPQDTPDVNFWSVGIPDTSPLPPHIALALTPEQRELRNRQNNHFRTTILSQSHFQGTQPLFIHPSGTAIQVPARQLAAHAAAATAMAGNLSRPTDEELEHLQESVRFQTEFEQRYGSHNL